MIKEMQNGDLLASHWIDSLAGNANILLGFSRMSPTGVVKWSRHEDYHLNGGAVDFEFTPDGGWIAAF